MARTYRVVVFDAALDALFLPGGEVNRYMHEYTKTTARFVRMYVPGGSTNNGKGWSTGRLRRSIKTDYSHGKRSTRSRVIAATPYAGYVDQGTGPYTNPNIMPIGAAQHHVVAYSHHRRGQTAQHFMSRAQHAAYARMIG